MPNAVAMITIMVPPGRSRNVAMGFFGSSAPIGSFIGCVLAGVFVELVSWEWMFFFVLVPRLFLNEYANIEQCRPCCNSLLDLVSCVAT